MLNNSFLIAIDLESRLRPDLQINCFKSVGIKNFSPFSALAFVEFHSTASHRRLADAARRRQWHERAALGQSVKETYSPVVNPAPEPRRN